MDTLSNTPQASLLPTNQVIDKCLLFVPVLLVLIYNLMFFNRYFPLSEGWWETYGYLINRGFIPYKDFNLEFPPLFIFLNAFYLKYISGNFFTLRLIGVFVYCINTFLLQVFLGLFFRKRTAIVITIFAIFLAMSDPVFIAKDYHTYVHILTAMSLIVGQRIMSLEQKILGNIANQVATKSLQYALVFILGALIALTTLLKQNIGFFLFLSYGLCLLLFLSPNFWSKKIETLLIYAAGILSVFFFFFMYFHTQGVDTATVIEHLFVKNDAKGSTFTVLTRFVTDPNILKPLLYSLFLSFICYAIIYAPFQFLSKVKLFFQKVLTEERYEKKINYFALGALIISPAYIFFQSHIIVISLSVLWYLLYEVYIANKKDHKYISLKFTLIPLATLVYCNTNTAGLNFTGMYFIIAYTCAYLVDVILARTTIKQKFIYIPLLLIIPVTLLHKSLVPYSWWGLEQQSSYKAKYELNHPKTRGIYVDKITQKTFDAINNSVNKYSKSDTDVYFFPSIPIFYYLHDKIPPYKNVIQWFDVISSKHITDELSAFDKNPPNLVVFLDPPPEVYKGHYYLTKHPLMQLAVKQKLEELTSNGTYRIAEYIIYSNDINTPYKYPSSPETNVIVIANQLLDNKSLKSIISVLKSNGLGKMAVDGIIKNNLRLKEFGEDTILQKGDIITIATDRDDDIPKIAAMVGYLKHTPYYTVKIYVKNNIEKV